VCSSDLLALAEEMSLIFKPVQDGRPVKKYKEPTANPYTRGLKLFGR
jgi:hypothetical protein